VTERTVVAGTGGTVVGSAATIPVPETVSPTLIVPPVSEVKYIISVPLVASAATSASTISCNLPPALDPTAVL